MSKTGRAGHARGRRQKEKEEKRKADSKRGGMAGRGPAAMIVMKLIDALQYVIVKIIKFFWYGISEPTYKFVYNLLFSEFHGFFAGKEKDGDCYSTGIVRYIITIFVPPVGVFMAKGLYGWPSIFISAGLSFLHMFAGIIYAFIVTHNNRYSDRYQKRELERIEESRKRRQVDPSKYTFVHLCLSVGFLVLLVYLLMRLAKFIANNI